MKSIRGKNLTAATHDIYEGFITVNPLFLKGLDAETIVALVREIGKAQRDIRSDRFPHGDIDAIRRRNMKLARLHIAVMVIRTYARTRKIQLV